MNFLSINNKESFFTPKTPKSLDSPQFLALNRDGTIFYSLKYQINLRVVDRPDDGLPEIVNDVPTRIICKYHVFSGNNMSYEMESDWDMAKLVKIVEFYILERDLVVVMSYDPELCAFSQTVLFLNSVLKTALIVAKKQFTITRITSPPFINTALLDSGQLIICGARATEAGQNIRMTIVVPIDPLSVKPHKDMSETLESFNKYLANLPNSKLIALFVLGVDEQQITVLLCDTSDERNCLMTGCVGRIDRLTGVHSLENIDNESVKFAEFVRVISLKNIRIRRQSVWMSLAIPNFEKSRTIWWQIKFMYARFALRMMYLGFRTFGFLAVYDRGFTLFCFIKFLQLLHGPYLFPPYSLDEKLYFYHLDLDRRQFFRINHQARLQDSKNDPNECDFAMNFDVDSNGGALVLDFPTLKIDRMRASYYPNPSKPQKLSRISMYSAYRNYPSFEKSSFLRKLTGVTEWKWVI